MLFAMKPRIMPELWLRPGYPCDCIASMAYFTVFNMGGFVPRVREMHDLIAEFVANCSEEIVEAA